MKYFFVSFLLLFTASAKSQTPVNYAEVVSTDSIPAKILFERARSWFVESFKDSKRVLEINDKETGELAGKGGIKATSQIMATSDFGRLTFHISIGVKEWSVPHCNK